MYVSRHGGFFKERVMAGEPSPLSWCRLMLWSLAGSVAHPGGYPYLAPMLMLVSLQGLFHERQLGSPNLKTWVWGTALGCGQLIWMATPTYVGTWCLFATPLLGAAIGLQWMVWARWGVRGSSPIALIQAGFLWALLEYSRETWLWSGLGFGALSTVLSAFPLGAIFANAFGHYGISWWIVTLGLLLWLHPRKLMTWFWACLPFVYGTLFCWIAPVQLSNPIKITGIQTGEYPSVHGQGSSLFEKWERLQGQLETIPRSSSSEAYPHLIVLPESTLRLDVDYPLQEGPRPYTLDQYYADQAELLQATIVAGIDWKDEEGFRTGQGLYAPDGSRWRYAKRKLVFGAEFIPYSWMKQLLKPFGIDESFVQGKETPRWSWQGGSLTPATCYESAFAGDLRNACLAQSDLITVSINDGWYGASSLRQHHAAAAQLRAIELGRPVFQVGHNGISCFWNSFGDCECCLESTESGIMVFQGALKLVTTPWLVWGPWGILAMGVFVTLTAATSAMRKRVARKIPIILG